jgi:hypothetical protein
MTDKRKNNGGHKTAGRKNLGADKMRQFSVKLTTAQALWFKANGVKALRELIEKAINEA